MSKSSKRIVALVLTLMMAFSLIAVPVSADQATTKADAQQYLVRDDVQLIQGDENGNPQWAAQLSRQDMVVILSRFAGEEEVAASYDTTNMTFTDIADPYYAPFVAWAQDLGITEGYSPEQFGFGDKLTAWQTKAFFLRALGYFPTDDEVDAMADQYGITVGSNVADDVQIARGDMAVMMFNTLFAENANGSTIQEERGLPEVVAAPQAALSNVAASETSTAKDNVTITGKVAPATVAVTVAGKAATVAADGTFSAVVTLAVGANNIEVVAGTAKQTVSVTRLDKASVTVTAATTKTFKAVFSAPVDSTKATFEVKKDTVKANVSTVTWNAAKTEATLEMASKLTEGDYVVTVGGVELVNASATVTVKDEEVGKIEFLSDKAVLAANGLSLTTTIKVTNQYGQDITKDANVTFTASKATAAVTADDKGKVTIPGAGNVYEVNDKVTVTALNAETGTFASAVLTVVEKASADAVEVVKLYNDDEDAVLEVNATGYSLLLNVKDQYGNLLDAAAATPGLVINSSNTTIATVGALADKTVDDVDYVELPLTIGATDGAATIRMISTTTGKATVYNVNVAKAAEVDSITLTAPEIAVANENVDFEVAAVDQNGKAVTNAADVDAGVSVSISGIAGLSEADTSFVKDGGKLVLRIDTTDAAALADDTTMYITAITATNKVVQKSIKLRKAAVPTTVGRIVNVKTGILVDNTSDILASDNEDDNNIEVYDQYDRVMDWADVFAAHKLVFTVEDMDQVSLGAAAATQSITAVEGKATMTAEAKGSQVVKVELQDKATSTTVVGSELEFTATVVELKDIKSFEVADIATVYAPGAPDADYNVDVDVYGVLSNGTKVAIPTSLYSVVSTLTGLTATANVLSADSVQDVAEPVVTFETGKDVKAGTVVVTIGSATGPVDITKDVTVSKATPVATSFKLDDGAVATVDNGTAYVTAANLADASDILDTVTITDQYGVENAGLTPVSIIYSNAYDESGAGLVLTNGATTGAATVAADATGDTFTVTFVYANGYKVSVNVAVQ